MLRGIAKRIDDSFVERWLGFLLLRCGVGCEETLLLPELAADGGERIGEGGMRLVIPSSGRDRLAGFGVEAGGEQRHQRKQREQARGGASDGPVRPLALGLAPEVVADRAEGDFDLPTPDVPGEDLQRLTRGIGAQQRLRIEAPGDRAAEPSGSARRATRHGATRR